MRTVLLKSIRRICGFFQTLQALERLISEDWFIGALGFSPVLWLQSAAIAINIGSHAIFVLVMQFKRIDAALSRPL